jgi:hypothetical protein
MIRQCEAAVADQKRDRVDIKQAHRGHACMHITLEKCTSHHATTVYWELEKVKSSALLIRGVVGFCVRARARWW